jgi:hypothetical protein
MKMGPGLAARHPSASKTRVSANGAALHPGHERNRNKKAGIAAGFLWLMSDPLDQAA